MLPFFLRHFKTITNKDTGEAVIVKRKCPGATTVQPQSD
jgi:hypothetical protein